LEIKGALHLSLEGKAAIVTGARRGIGKAIALGFAEAGADVAICDCQVDDGELHAVAREIRNHGRRSMALQADISLKPDVDNLVKRTKSAFGKIDILVNNAGVSTGGSLLDLSEEEWDRVMNINLKGFFLCCQAAAKEMALQRKGSIINIASVIGMKAFVNEKADILNTPPEACVYPITKAGTIMLTRRLAWELAGLNIRVNAIAPGQVLTEFNRAWGDLEEQKRRSAFVPMNRMAVPDDIAGATLFLASETSNYITGHTIVVDGGLLA